MEIHNEGTEYYLATRPKWRRIVGAVMCFFGLHRSGFTDREGARTEYNQCVRCGEYKRMKF